MQLARMNAFCTLGLLLFSALVAAGAVMASRTDGNLDVPLAPPTMKRPSAEPVKRPADGAALAVGDRLSVTFLESVDISGGGPTHSGAGSMLRAFYQRTDLSGTYSIDQEGILSLPQLGKFVARGVLPHALEAQLTAAFARIAGRSAQVSVTIQDRRPVYVVGTVRSPGAVKHTGPMMVVQAVALSGGIESWLGSGAQIERARELERQGKLAQQLKRLLARRARLEAERKGSHVIEIPTQLIALAGKEGAEVMVGAEQALLRLSQSRLEQKRAEVAASLVAAREELESMRAKLDQLDAQSRILADHLDSVLKLKSLATRASVTKAQSEVAENEARRQDTRAAIAAAEFRLIKAEGGAARLELDHAAEIATSIASTDAELSDIRIALHGPGPLVKDAGGPVVARAFTAMQPVYEIVRDGGDGAAVIPAQEGTLLLPGDVLKVKLETAAENVERDTAMKAMPTIR